MEDVANHILAEGLNILEDSYALKIRHMPMTKQMSDQANAKSIPSSIAHETADTTANILISVTNGAGKIESIIGEAVFELND